MKYKIIIIGLMIFGTNLFGQKFKTIQIVNGKKVTINYKDFFDLRNNKQYDEFLLGKINVTSEQLVLTDPFLLYNPHPIDKKIANGQYNMFLYFIKTNMGYRVAYAMIEFDSSNPAKWECALINDSLLENSDKKVNGLFPVDAGLLSISDFESFKLYKDFLDKFAKEHPNGNYYDDYFSAKFAKNGHKPEGTHNGGDWINYPLKDNQNIIMFSSGLGDGLYPAYWGLDDSGRPLKLIVDLLVLKRIGK
jgi:hypothetical protein